MSSTCKWLMLINNLLGLGQRNAYFLSTSSNLCDVSIKCCER